MITALGLRLSAFFRRTAPEPFVLAVLLTVLTGVLALVFGCVDDAEGFGPRALALLDAWRSDSGLWRFLRFGMQMCLILVTGHALAASAPVRRLIAGLAALPRSGGQAVVVVSLTACLAGLVNWGLGLIVGALLARDVARSMRARGLALHYPLLAAAGYMGMLVWHGGLSGSAPVTSSTPAGASAVLPPETVERYLPDGVSLASTLASPLNLFVTGGLLILIPLTLRAMSPRDPAQMLPPDNFEPMPDPPDEPAPAKGRTIPERMEHSRVLVWLIAVPLLLASLRHAFSDGLGAIGLNELNGLMLGLGLALHGSARSYVRAVEDGARGCAGVILQFPLYAGIMAMLEVSGLASRAASATLDLAGERAVPLVVFMIAGVLNLFVPSGGGQWGIQGPIALEAGGGAGIAPETIIMSVAYGDQLTNMLQPFWALPLLAITGVRARDIVGYTAIVMVVAGCWMALGLWLF